MSTLCPGVIHTERQPPEQMGRRACPTDRKQCTFDRESRAALYGRLVLYAYLDHAQRNLHAALERVNSNARQTRGSILRRSCLHITKLGPTFHESEAFEMAKR